MQGLHLTVGTRILAVTLVIGAWILFLWGRHEPFYRFVAVVMLMSGVVLIRAPRLARTREEQTDAGRQENAGRLATVGLIHWVVLLAMSLISGAAYLLMYRSEAMGITQPWPVYLFAATSFLLFWSIASLVLKLAKR